MKAALETKDKQFFLDDKPLVILSGAVHYFRMVPEYWTDVLLKVKACGLNTVETYVPWNLHEEKQGTFNFEHLLDLRSFIKKAHDVGLYVIFRPGPYICSEWDYGGLPSWLLHDPNMKVRSTYQPFMEAVAKYFDKLLPLVVDLQYSRGGPIIAIQVENEYGSYGNDMQYMTLLKERMAANGIFELFFTSDNGMGIQRGGMSDVLRTANFQYQEHGELMFNYLRNYVQPDKPLMVMEFWSGWFDHWGSKHQVWNAEDMEKVLRWILNQGSSVNFYMFFGGTNFGWMNGANEDIGATNNTTTREPYAPDVTSYDYDAPITEWGDLTDKYYRIRSVLQEILPHQVSSQLPLPPSDRVKATYGEFAIEQMLPFEHLLQHIQPLLLADVTPMEMLNINNNGGQGYGLILYRKKIKHGSKLTLPSQIKDYAVVLLNGKEKHCFSWSSTTSSVYLDCNGTDEEESTLDILVENCGRVNYGRFGSNQLDTQRKGLSDSVYLDAQKLEDWQIFPLEFDKEFINSVSNSVNWTPYLGPLCDKVPGMYRCVLSIQQKPQDTFLDIKGWSKGVVFVNRFNIGRYYNVGPQKTLYIPAPLLKEGNNEILVFEIHQASDSLCFVDQPSLGEAENHVTPLPLHDRLQFGFLRAFTKIGGKFAWMMADR